MFFFFLQGAAGPTGSAGKDGKAGHPVRRQSCLCHDQATKKIESILIRLSHEWSRSGDRDVSTASC